MQYDPQTLAPQLRRPEGAYGEEVGRVMTQFNADANAWTLRLLDVQPRDHVLEIGFGPGDGLAEAVRLTPQGFVAGIDHSETMLRMAEQRNHRAVMQEHLELTLGDAAALPYGDDGFDKVFSVNVMHFWEDPLLCAREIRRVLKEGGRAVVFLVHPAQWPAGLKETGVFRAYAPEEMAAVFTEAGFREARAERKGDEGMAVVATK